MATPCSKACQNPNPNTILMVESCIACHRHIVSAAYMTWPHVIARRLHSRAWNLRQAVLVEETPVTRWPAAPIKGEFSGRSLLTWATVGLVLGWYVGISTADSEYIIGLDFVQYLTIMGLGIGELSCFLEEPCTVLLSLSVGRRTNARKR